MGFFSILLLSFKTEKGCVTLLTKNCSATWANWKKWNCKSWENALANRLLRSEFLGWLSRSIVWQEIFPCQHGIKGSLHIIITYVLRHLWSALDSIRLKLLNFFIHCSQLLRDCGTLLRKTLLRCVILWIFVRQGRSRPFQVFSCASKTSRGGLRNRKKTGQNGEQYPSWRLWGPQHFWFIWSFSIQRRLSCKW